MRAGSGLLVGILLLAACEPIPVDPERVARDCERRAQDAQGPSGSVEVGASSRSGAFTDVSIALSTDYLRGRDPLEVYRSCVYQRTGAGPIRPPSLRP